MLIRYSVAKEFNTQKEPYDNFTPGISLKFLRDNTPSANLMAMFTTSGQHSWNPFAFPFNNTFGIPDDSSIGIRLLGDKFSTATNFVSSIGVKDISAYDEHGVRAAEPKFPYKLVFIPSAKAKSFNFPDAYTESYLTQVAKVKKGDVIYEVHAVDQPGCADFKIGKITLTEDFTTSKFGDESLFFRHSKVDEEDKEKGWTRFRDYLSVFSLKHGEKPAERTSGCPFAKFFK